MESLKNIIVLTVIIVLSSLIQLNAQEKIIKYKIPSKYAPFPYKGMKLQGLLGQRYKLNAYNGLLKIPYYSYLRAYNFGVAAYWPSGEYLGKFVQGLEHSYNYYRDMDFIERIQIIVDKWVQAQAADGYLGTNPDGYSIGQRWNFWASWDHKYTILGLLAYYELSGEKLILQTAKKTADVVCAAFGDKKMQRNLMETGHSGLVGGSILEPMTYLYQYTGEQKYLDFCQYILKAFESEKGPQIITELTQRSGRVDKIGIGKGYEMISCLIGILRMYQLTGNDLYLKTAVIAWNDIQQNRLYITGTATQCECFYDNNYLPANENDQTNCWGEIGEKNEMGEGCVTAHWIFLSTELFFLTGDTKYVDEIEKSLYNHLLGSQSPFDGTQSYYTALIGHKNFNMPNIYEGEPPCCISSVMRCISKIPEIIWTRSAENGLNVLLYNAGVLKADIKTKSGDTLQIKLVVETDYPANGRIKLSVLPNQPAEFNLGLRVPGWCPRFNVVINGKENYQGRKGSLLVLNRKWQSADIVEIDMDMASRFVEGAPMYAGYYALVFGPLVFALDEELNPGIDVEKVKLKTINVADVKPAKERLPEGWIGNLSYALPAAAPEAKELIFVPFLDAGQHGSKFAVWVKLE
jgi:uncharacterized protein